MIGDRLSVIGSR